MNNDVSNKKTEADPSSCSDAAAVISKEVRLSSPGSFYELFKGDGSE